MNRTLFTGLVAITSLTAQAESVEGDRSFDLSGNGSSDDDFNTTAFGGSASLGYSVTDSQEIGVRQDINVVEFEDATTVGMGSRGRFITTSSTSADRNRL